MSTLETTSSQSAVSTSATISSRSAASISVDLGNYVFTISFPSWRAFFLWRSSLYPFIEQLIHDDEKRLLGLKNTSSYTTILLLSVFLPYQSDYNADAYQVILGKIQAISDSFESANIFIIGDFNANIKKPSLLLHFSMLS